MPLTYCNEGQDREDRVEQSGGVLSLRPNLFYADLAEELHYQQSEYYDEQLLQANASHIDV